MPPGKVIPFPTPTARFSLVVRRCGAPAVHLTLVSPQKDAELQRLDRQARVMTVRQAHRGMGADYGVVGLFAPSGAQLLVFPKSLRRFAGKRIVGINYDLLTGVNLITGAVAEKSPARKVAENRASTKRVPPEAAAVEIKPEPRAEPAVIEPLTIPQILPRLQAARRLLSVNKYAKAQQAISALIENIRLGLESP